MRRPRPSPVRRMMSLFELLGWLTPLAGDPLSALRLAWRLRSNPEDIHSVLYSGRQIWFRKQDLQALREVLINREYSFAAESFNLSQSPHILDVGAHIGTFALWCLEQAPEARILCVEANPETDKILRMNVDRWSSSGATLRAEQAAAGDRDGAILRIRDFETSSMSSRVDEAGTLHAPSLSLPSLLDLCAPDSEDIDLAKIDIEGSEEAFLCSHPHSLRRIQALIVELHPSLCDSERVRSLLQAVYPKVIELPDRVSTKPLLFCHRQLRHC